MMKFLAILKDSFREAIDAKIFSFMVGLSLLVVLFLFSFSFRPVSAEEEIRRSAENLDKIAPPDHSTTSSAMASKGGGI